MWYQCLKWTLHKNKLQFEIKTYIGKNNLKINDTFLNNLMGFKWAPGKNYNKVQLFFSTYGT